MADLAPARPRHASPAAVDPEPIRLLGLFALAAFTLFTQLDAVSNRLTAGLPVTLIELTLAALAVATMLLVFVAPMPTRAPGSAGPRLFAIVLPWAVFCWTLSEHRGPGLTYLIRYATTLLAAASVFLFVDRAWKLRVLLWAMMLASGVAAAIVMVETVTHTRLVATALAAVTADFDGVARSSGGSDQNPTTAAQMLMTGVALATGLLFAGESRGRRLSTLVMAGIVLAGTVALALMSARSAIIGLAFAAGLVLLGFRRKPYFPMILAGAALAGVVGILLAPPILLERFAAIGDFGKDQTLYRRISYLRIGADLFAGSPIWGIGPGNFPLYYITDAYRWMPGRILYPRELHNTYLDILTELGVIGGLLYAVVIGAALRGARRVFAPGSQATLAAPGFAIAVALAGLLAACVFMPHKNLRYLWLLIALGIQCGRLARAEAAE